MTLFKYILIDAENAPSYLDFNILEHHQVYTQTSNILIAVSDCARFKSLKDEKLDEITKDIFTYINQIRLITGDRMYYKVFRWALSKIKEYEAYSNSIEKYEYSNNLFRLYTNLEKPLNKHSIED